MTALAVSKVRPWLHALTASLPQGRMLPEEVWRGRHRTIVRLALLQAVALAVYALVMGSALHHAIMEATLVAGPVLLGLPRQWSRKVRSAAVTTSLFTASAVLVHLSGGVTEAHFHFFVMVSVVALYQDWVPFGVGLGITVFHHGVLGTLHPHDVYDHSGALRSPWLWAAVHGGFVLAASCASLASWRLNEQQELRDALTGLGNRTLLSESLTRTLTRPGAVSVIFIDLDDFKDVNDSRGHAAGDHLLQEVTERLRGCVRFGDVVARLGGDEFAIMLPGDASIAHQLAQHFLTALAEPVIVDGHALYVNASIGIADAETATVREAGVLLRNADLAMYLAKSNGKGRVVVYAQGMAAAAHDRAILTADLTQALRGGQLELHYQATVHVADGAAEGYEALLRWHHPQRGLVPPLDFIGLAESSGLIHTIGAWALRTASAQAAAWSAQRSHPVQVAVNLSAVQLIGGGIEHVVLEALRASGLPASQLTLEVTESVLVHDLEVVAMQLARLRELGVRIAIDDFGTGYSSLSYLRRLPVDIVKIDRSFVADLDDGDAAATALVAAIIDLARSLGLSVIAEGVETEQQAGVLRALRCGSAQGFLYARPVPAHLVSVPAPRQVTAGHRVS